MIQPSQVINLVVSRLSWSFMLWVLVAPVVTLAEESPLLQQAQNLIQEQRHAEAYTLLEQQSEALAGQVEYDYLLGVAALGAGKPEQAMFALERVVATHPGHAAARMELVSAYTQLGMNQLASHHLAILERQSPPDRARQVMARFQDVLRPRLSGTPDPVRVIGLGGGYDSNVGSFPDVGLNLGGITLSVSPVESSFSQLRGTLWEPIKLNDKQRLDLTLHGQQRNYQDESATQYNLGLLHGGMLLNTTLDPVNKLGVGLQLNRLWLDGNQFRDFVGLNVRWERRLGADLKGELSAEAQQYHFDPDTYDYDAVGMGGRLFRTWNPKLRTTLSVNLEQESDVGGRLGGDANRWSLGGEVNYLVTQRDRVALSLDWNDTLYATDYAAATLYNPAASPKERHDSAIDLGLNWRRTLAREWELNGEMSYRTQASTLRFYDLDRWTAQLTVLRYF